jgi:N-acetylglucosamine-6-phosphate deacetylase
MQMPDKVMVEDIYGEDNLRSSIKMVTLAPELNAATDLIKYLRTEYQIVSSLGHSAADFDTGARALKSGARSLTHLFNAMEPLAHRFPGLAGLTATPNSSHFETPYYSIIADGIHLHPAVVSMAYRSNPEKCILITDSIEMAGLPDGLYPGHAQIPHLQRKVGNKVTIEGTDTLIGSCIGLDECVRNLVNYSGCNLAQAVRCVTENVANLMGVKDRGVIETGRRADFVCLDSKGHVQRVWIKGRMLC